MPTSKLVKQVADYCWSNKFLGKSHSDIARTLESVYRPNPFSNSHKMCLESSFRTMQQHLKMHPQSYPAGSTTWSTTACFKSICKFMRSSTFSCGTILLCCLFKSTIFSGHSDEIPGNARCFHRGVLSRSAGNAIGYR